MLSEVKLSSRDSKPAQWWDFRKYPLKQPLSTEWWEPSQRPFHRNPLRVWISIRPGIPGEASSHAAISLRWAKTFHYLVKGVTLSFSWKYLSCYPERTVLISWWRDSSRASAFIPSAGQMLKVTLFRGQSVIWATRNPRKISPANFSCFSCFLTS